MKLFRRILFLLAAAIGAGGAATEERLELRAGEHGAFSRVVIPPFSGAPKISSTGRLVRIKLKGRQSDADLTNLTVGRRAARIANASQSKIDGDLVISLELNCDCRPHVSATDDGATILDVFDGAPDSRKLEAERAKDALKSALKGVSSVKMIRLKSALQPPPWPVGNPAVDIGASLDPGAAAPQGEAFEGPSGSKKHDLQGTANAASFDCSLEADFAPSRKRVRDVQAIGPDHVGDPVSTTPSHADALAVSYLSRGFFAEAFAVAQAAERTDRLSVVAAIAGTLDGRPMATAQTLAPFVECGPAHALFHAAARTRHEDVGESPIADEHIAVLAGLPVEFRFALAERLAFAAHQAGDAALSSRLAAIARDASPDRASAPLDIISVAQGGPNEEASERLAATARDAGEMQFPALEALQAKPGRAEPVADRHLISDLGIAARLAKTDDQKLRAADRAAELLVANGEVGAAVAQYASVRAATAQSAQLAKDAAAETLLPSLRSDDFRKGASAASTFLRHRDFLSASAHGPELRIAVASRLAAIGGDEEFVSGVLDDAQIPELTRMTLQATAALNRGDLSGAQSSLLHRQVSADARRIAVESALRLGDEGAALDAARRASIELNQHGLLAQTAFRLGRFEEAARAYEQSSPVSASPDDAVRSALASLAAGAPRLPSAAAESLATDAGALKSMFQDAPVFDPRRAESSIAFADRLSMEIEFIRRALKPEDHP